MIKSKELLREFEELFDSLGIVIKYDNIKNDGGYCKYKEKEFIIINKILPLKNKLKIYKKILKNILQEKGDIFIKPLIREFLEDDKDS
ncbi:MAG: hypothetical protein QME48_06585 [bacterium]|uniref:Uncharacterized protein n=2 Tax=Bacteria candidate phyla TaxID=1783234 RepID=A0A101I448_UNCT6|nr:MAG: Uncharacterized protein XD76_0105 [candidate division TA06 bacterium 32_111]KUK88079.1 MAG: Uncharacterized protein XE03_0085 [candidate division TA06 bacterium 34_109]MDI6700880.1 hypothetical protein [bacterium]HAF07009.1 hypothetical protein [candidate division WOR-3 bacterium]HCP16923.1 hypothetical protein [candidate division WOR-3 bacterium]